MTRVLEPDEALRHCGLRITPQRRRVLAAITDSDRPLTVQEIRGKALPAPDKVTLYRILDALVDKGLAHRAVGEDGVARFCLAAFDSPGCDAPGHGHLHCRRCGRMECIGPKELGMRVDHIEERLDIRIDAVDMRLDGLCRRCNSQEIR
jgi:Fe2+ or Zn2+ uptake regulation protein